MIQVGWGSDRNAALLELAGEPTPGRILREVAAEYGVTQKTLLSRRRDKSLIPPRRMLACRLRQECDMNLSDIGRFMQRDHTTVRHHLVQGGVL